MLKKPITYTDFNGEEVTEEFYFNLTKAELVQLEMSRDDGLSEALKKIVASRNGAEIMREFEEIILMSVGERSPDGKRFVKSREIRDHFKSTQAYSELFVELVTDAGAASEFVQGIMPGDLMAAAQLKLEEEMKGEDVVEFAQQEPEETYIPPPEKRLITREDAAAMDSAELATGLAAGILQVKLMPADLKEMDPDDLNSGLASGRYSIYTTPEQ